MCVFICHIGLHDRLLFSELSAKYWPPIIHPSNYDCMIRQPDTYNILFNIQQYHVTHIFHPNELLLAKSPLFIQREYMV